MGRGVDVIRFRLFLNRIMGILGYCFVQYLVEIGFIRPEICYCTSSWAVSRLSSNFDTGSYKTVMWARFSSIFTLSVGMPKRFALNEFG